MEEEDTDEDATAKWWMAENEDVWTPWVPEDIAEKVKEALK